MTQKFALLLPISIGLLVFCACISRPFQKLTSPTRPDILMLSFCSINRDRLPYFGRGDPAQLPTFSEVFNKSTLFTSAVTDISWSNIGRFFRQGLQNQISAAGYAPLPLIHETQEGLFGFKFLLRIPVRERNEYFGPHDQIFLDGISDLESSLSKPRSAPLLLQAHFKFMHYPYLLTRTQSHPDELRGKLDDGELALLKSYLSSPERFPEKFAFFQALFGGRRLETLIEKTTVKGAILTTNKSWVQRWRMSKNFSRDLSILRKIYDLKLKEADGHLARFMKYYYERLEPNTILILIGDHGESLLEHDYLTHGEDPYDEVARFFFSIHFPRQSLRKVHAPQISQDSISQMITNLATGAPQASTIESFLTDTSRDEFIPGFSCSGRYSSLRVKGKWKLLVDVADDTVRLFDLESDPGETKDVAANHRDLVLELKAKALDNLSKKFWPSEGCIQSKAK